MTLDKGQRVSFRIAYNIKTSRPGKHTDELTFIAYPQDPNICMVNTLEEKVLMTNLMGLLHTVPSQHG